MTNEPENLRTREPESLGDDPLAELRRELRSVKPSPAFAAGVRERIEIEKDRRARASWWFDWRSVAAAGATAVLVAAVWAAKNGADGGAEVRATNGASSGANPGANVTAGAGANAGANVGATAGVPPSVNPRVNDRAHSRPNPRTEGGVSPVNVMVTAAQSESPLEVITQQPAILRMLWERHRAAELALAATQPMPDEVRDVVIANVEVEPVVVKWLVEPPATSGALPVIKRIAADMAERSAK